MRVAYVGVRVFIVFKSILEVKSGLVNATPEARLKVE
jgi:hypothetical protein